ncbi:hypothetical protein VTI28DRAFT_9615 [Corynascus sepedonium]
MHLQKPAKEKKKMPRPDDMVTEENHRVKIPRGSPLDALWQDGEVRESGRAMMGEDLETWTDRLADTQVWNAIIRSDGLGREPRRAQTG